MIPPRFRRELAWLAVAAAALLLFLGTRGLNEPDEGRFAEIGREMAATGEWLVPHLNGFEHFQKPPLLYWATALSIRLFGANEWAARLPSALAALGTIVLTWLIARRFFDQSRAIAAGLVLLSCVEFFTLSRLLTCDMMLTFWITAAVTALVYRRHWLFFACMGLGFLAKGPMALVVPACAALGWQYALRRAGRPEPLPWARGMGLALLIGLAWFITLSITQPRLFDYFWRYELLERFASKAHGRSKPFWFFIPVLIIGFLPWTFWLPGAARAAWQRIRAKSITPEQGVLLGWVVPPFLILSLSGSKLPTYVLPLLPALAIVVAGRFRLPEGIWKVAAPVTAALVIAFALAPLVEHRFRQQAPVRDLAALITAEPDAAAASVFACEVRAHGFEFRLRRLVGVTRSEADVVLPPSPKQQERLFESPEACEEHYARQKRSYGIIRSGRFGKTFPRERWTALQQEGDFILITNVSQVSPRTPALPKQAQLEPAKP